MSGSSFDQKEQIRNAIDIVELISPYVPLQRKGRIYTGRCPWHDDSRPSLQVNPERQSFKCWVCDIGGDIFDFIMKIENVDFREAMEILAEKAGITLTKDKFFGRKQGADSGIHSSNVTWQNESEAVRYIPEEIKKPTLYRALGWLADKYHEFFLNDAEAQTARDYIKGRGIDDAMIRQFRIGYSPANPDVLVKLVGSDRVRVAILEAAGVLSHWSRENEMRFEPPGPQLSEYERRQYADRFRGRVMFPIRDAQERTVAFGGRVLPGSDNPAKYVNSPETAIFSKHKMLYGLDVARNAMRKNRRVLITEGYTDCIVAHQYGFPETVAVLGTAVGPDHVKVLKRFADKMYLVLDGDEAGRKRAMQVLGHFVTQGVDLSVLTLPDDKDPCEFLLEYGHDAFEKMLQQESKDAMDHALQAVIGDIDVDRDIVAASKALDSLIDIVSLYPSETAMIDDPVRIRMEKTIQRLARRFHVDERQIRMRITEFRTRRQHQESRRPSDFGSVNSPAVIPANSDRFLFVYPIAEHENETDEYLQHTFCKFSRDVWDRSDWLPSQLEREYLQFWFACPDMFRELAAKVDRNELRSPVTIQLDLLGRHLLDRNIEPNMNEIILRYDDSRMKNFLIGLDEASERKELRTRMETEENRRLLLEEIVAGFNRQREDRESPRMIDELRESGIDGEEKIKKLLEMQAALQKKQKDRFGGTGVMDEPGPDDK